MLPYTAEIYFSLIGRYVDALWPAPVVAIILSAAAIALTVRPVAGADRVVALLLVAGWATAGVVFHLQYLATLDFLAPVYGVAFLLQALLLAWHGAVCNRLVFRFRPDATGWTGLTLAILALAGYPLLDGWMRAEWLGARLVGLTPSATVLFTLGLLLVAERAPRHLLIIPVLWSLVAGIRGWSLGIPADQGLPLFALGAAFLAMRKRR